MILSEKYSGLKYHKKIICSVQQKHRKAGAGRLFANECESNGQTLCYGHATTGENTAIALNSFFYGIE